MSKQQVQLLNQSIGLGDMAYEGLERVAAVITGLEAIAGNATICDRTRVMQIERIAKAALYLAHDYMALIDVETEDLKGKLKGASHE